MISRFGFILHDNSLTCYKGAPQLYGPQKEPQMASSPIHQKYPEDSANRDYDIFEELPDGSTVWRACVFGMGRAELKLRDLARESNNRFFAFNPKDRSEPVIQSSKSDARQNLHRAS